MEFIIGAANITLFLDFHNKIWVKIFARIFTRRRVDCTLRKHIGTNFKTEWNFLYCIFPLIFIFDRTDFHSSTLRPVTFPTAKVVSPMKNEPMLHQDLLRCSMSASAYSQSLHKALNLWDQSISHENGLWMTMNILSELFWDFTKGERPPEL